jgi:site-specific DNA-methyltransferase (adenine-specific)
MNKLYFGDNLDVLRSMPPECVDLIYLDPPFNSNADYNIIYGTRRGGPSQAQSHAFVDTWTWGRDAQRALEETAERHIEAGALLDSFQRVFPGSNMLAYLAMMAVRLIEMRRVLKPTGSIYLHCDPTASHYLKTLLDAVFGPQQFLNEIVWPRANAHNFKTRMWPRQHDILLLYSRGETFTLNPIYQPYGPEQLKRYRPDETGRLYTGQDMTVSLVRRLRQFEWRGVKPPPHRSWGASIEQLEAWYKEGRILLRKDGCPRLDGLKVYLDQTKGKQVGTIWNDIERISNTAGERLGYPTQKPLALLERIIEASSNVGDVVLDPFCGCGTAIEAAEKLKRKWIGIDVTYLAIHVVEGRLVKSFGKKVRDTYKLFGQPQDAEDAKALAARDWLEFQKWAVFVLGGLPKDRPGPDGGIDGFIRYHRVGIEQPNRAVVSVKGGTHVGVDAIHKLKSVVKREKAELGILVCLDRPTSAMQKEAASEGDVGPSSRRVPKIQIVTVNDIFTSHPIELPGMLDPPEIVRGTQPPMIRRKRKQKIEGQTEMIFALDNPRVPNFPEMKKKNRQIREVDIEVIRPGSKRVK